MVRMDSFSSLPPPHPSADGPSAKCDSRRVEVSALDIDVFQHVVLFLFLF